MSKQVDEATRSSMWKLRQTWKDVFSPQKLYSLDLRVNGMDPAWPVAKDPPPGIPSVHLNPRFLTLVNKQIKIKFICRNDKQHIFKYFYFFFFF